MGLNVTDLWMIYPTPGEPLVVLQGVDLALARGDALAVTGPSGSGKSTLLYALGALERPARGTVLLEGVDPFRLSEKELAAFRNRRVGFVFQDHHLLPQCTVLENVLLPTLVPPAAADREARARALLERVGLAERLEHRPPELSGGERQRVAVARALVNRPLLVLADEPTGNLDRRSAQAVGGLLLEMARQEQAILIAATHSLELAGSFPRRAELAEGQLAASE